MVQRLVHSRWLKGHDHPCLAGGEVHVWRACLDRPEEELADLARLLSPDERERAGRFHFERDRRHFVAGRGILRGILGRYLGRAPEQLAFVYGLRGKPVLPETPLHFNLAHSGGLAVLAVAHSGAVGIDLERVRPVPDCERIMTSFFSPAEVAAILALPPADRLLAFFTCWIRKEAYLKARGDGIATELHRFSVSAGPGSPPRLLHVDGHPQETQRWSFRDLPLESGYLGVVAWEGSIRSVQHRLWSGSDAGEL